jgi:hypothetical protein
VRAWPTPSHAALRAGYAESTAAGGAGRRFAQIRPIHCVSKPMAQSREATARRGRGDALLGVTFELGVEVMIQARRTDIPSTGMGSDTAVHLAIQGIRTALGLQRGCSEALFRLRRASAIQTSSQGDAHNWAGA